MIFASFFIFYSIVSQKMDHFDISFACSIFSKSWEVTNYGFLGVAHLPLSRQWGWYWGAGRAEGDVAVVVNVALSVLGI